MKRYFLALGVLCLLLSEAALTQDPSPAAKVKVITIPACAFQFMFNDIDYSQMGNLLCMNSGFTPRDAFAPITLPNKTVVLKMEMVCLDNSTTKNIPLSLVRVSNVQYSQTIGTIYSLDASSSWRTFVNSSFTDKVIDNVNYCYYLKLTFQGLWTDGIAFGHVKIYYRGKW
jgi:hypothetical protein